MFAQFLADGVVVGCIYALVALGFTVVYNATETVNFAVGESLMLGAYVFLTFFQLWKLPYPLALLLTLLGAALFGYLVFDRLIERPLARAPLLSRVICLMGLASVIKGSVRLVWGADAWHLRSPFPTRPIEIGPLRLTIEEIIIVGVTLAVVLALFLFFERTRLGMAMRAAFQNRRGAVLMGVNIRMIFALAWIIGTALSFLGGTLLGPLLLVDPDMGAISFKSFTAVVLGGFGSLPGAIIGGILLGVVENLAGGYIRSDLQIAATFVLLVAVLAVRPSGLLGRASARRV